MIVGTGVDIVATGRFGAVLERQGERFIQRVFTSAEQEYCRAHRNPITHYAARFAAKEAFLKALGTGWAGGIRWLDIEVLRDPGAAPSIRLQGIAAQVASEKHVSTVHVSLSHSDEAAVATVILES
ncbi:MAG: holo-ACP synthase [Acidobacteria bacterium]|nr:holo-ACP synthase [Acidobacteriota bacterium]